MGIETSAIRQIMNLDESDYFAERLAGKTKKWSLSYYRPEDGKPQWSPYDPAQNNVTGAEIRDETYWEWHHRKTMENPNIKFQKPRDE